MNGGSGRALVAGAIVVLVGAGCGAQATTTAAPTLEAWSTEACEAFEAHSPATARESESSAVPPEEIGSSEETRESIEALENALEEVRAIPRPPEVAAAIDRLLTLLTRFVADTRASLPRIEKASQRLQRIIAETKPEDLPPPPDEPTTVAGGIMARLMAIPEFKAAYADLMRAYQPATPPADLEELERLTARLGVDECEGAEDSGERELSAAELERCGARGKPVSLRELVEVFRANGITLEIQREPCTKPQSEHLAGFDADATNGGPDGISGPDERDAEEGYVLCDVGDTGRDRDVSVTKFETDTETRMSTLNVQCTIYPHSRAVEAEQVARLKRAMEALG